MRDTTRQSNCDRREPHATTMQLGWDKLPRARWDELRRKAVSPTEMAVYEYLFIRRGENDEVSVPEKEIAAATGTSRRTVTRAISGLEAAQMITKTAFCRHGHGRTRNTYQVNTYNNCEHGFEKAPHVRRAALQSGTMSPADLVVYDYLRRHMSSGSECWAAEATIAEQTGISDRSVTDCMSHLCAIGAVERIGWHDTRSGWRSRVRLVCDLALTLMLHRDSDGSCPLEPLDQADVTYKYALEQSSPNSAYALNLRGTEATDYILRHAMDRARLRAESLGIDPDEYECGWYARHPNASRCRQAPGWARTIWERGYQHRNGSAPWTDERIDRSYVPHPPHAYEDELVPESVDDVALSEADMDLVNILGCDIDASVDIW